LKITKVNNDLNWSVLDNLLCPYLVLDHFILFSFNCQRDFA